MDDLTLTLNDDILDRLRSAAENEGVEVKLLAMRLIDQGLPRGRTGVALSESGVAAKPYLELSEAEREERLKRILALGRKPDEPFNLKAESDALWDFIET